MNEQNKNSISVKERLDRLDGESARCIAATNNNRALLWAIIESHPDVTGLKAKFLEYHAHTVEQASEHGMEIGVPAQEAFPLFSQIEQDACEIISRLNGLCSRSNT